MHMKDLILLFYFITTLKHYNGILLYLLAFSFYYWDDIFALHCLPVYV